MRARLVRLEDRLFPEHKRWSWCCVVVDPEDTDALPPTCPHGGCWLLMFTDAAARARCRACHPGTLVRSFTIRLDRANGDEEVTDA
jgi:hypothetical protein